jgi:two-component system, OmpR family, response regulator
VRVLLVEDDARLAAAIGRGLRYEGIVADVARAGADALGMTRATEYDAVVLDVMMPGIDGFETCRQDLKFYAPASVPSCRSTPTEAAAEASS